MLLMVCLKVSLTTALDSVSIWGRRLYGSSALSQYREYAASDWERKITSELA